jgi:dihydrolipoamide dehydrogenase
MEFDVLVVGAGPGGYVCAIRAAQHGYNVAVVEREYYGGVCLNVGCIPSKAMITAAHFLHKLNHDAKDMGIEAKGVKLDAKKLQSWKQSVSDRMSGGIEQLLKGNKITTLFGEATLLGNGQVRVETKEGEQTVTAKNIVLANGSRPIQIPGFEFDETDVMSSTGALALEEVPEKIAVIGGGYIGLEIGSYLSHLGSEVTVIEASDKLLGGVADPDAVQIVERKLKKSGVKVVKSAFAKSFKKMKSGLEVTYEVEGKAEKVKCSRILVTVGRKPNSDQAGIRDIGLEITETGFVKINEQCKTNVPGIYAIGDVAGQPMLAHKASHEGVLVADVIAGQNRVYDAKTVPAVVFTDPEIASAGMTEEECKAAGYNDLKISKFPFGANGRAVSLMATDGFVKIIARESDNVVLGVHIVGPEASNMISEAALAIEMGATLDDIALTIHPHPTLGETMMESAEMALGHAIHVIQRPLRR